MRDSKVLSSAEMEEESRMINEALRDEQIEKVAAETIEKLKQEAEQSIQQAGGVRGVLAAKGVTEEVILRWKSQYPELYVLVINSDEVFVMRPLYDLEYRTMMQENKRLVEGSQEYDEALINKALLFPPQNHAAGGMGMWKAGTRGTVTELIKYVSNFIPIGIAISALERL